MDTDALRDVLVEVAVPLPVQQTFTYSASALPPVGVRVLVPLGNRTLTGYVLGEGQCAPGQDVRPIGEVLDEEPLFDRQDLEFYRWAASYYSHPLGLTIKTALPQGLTARYDRVVSLNGPGRAGRRAADPVLPLLQQAGPIPLQDLRRQLGRSRADRAVRALQQQGLVTIALKRRGGTVSVRTEKWYAPGSDPPEALRGRQQQVYDFLLQRGQTSATTLRQKLPGCAAQVRALVRKGCITVEEREVFRRPPAGPPIFTEPVHHLTDAQQQVLEQCGDRLHQGGFYPLLLHGVTGSGKTELYLQVIEAALARGAQCLYLVPEIALTAQLWDRISSRLPVCIAMLHSSLTPAERFDAWRLIRRGDIKIVIGARSAVFAAFSTLGAVIVDEEHDASYKQEDGLRYNARDLAVVKARLAGCPVVLGSATPSLESCYNAAQGKYHLARMDGRVAGRSMPRVVVVDMKAGKTGSGIPGGIVSARLRREIEQRLEKRQQTLLFLNRRGFAPAYLCRQCGYSFRCPHCDVPLIHHRDRNTLLCHYCNHHTRPATECPECGSYFLVSLGWGTERLAAELARMFPGARIARMDRDSVASGPALRTLMARMHHNEIDVLIGTQMIVKGYHLPNVTLVGVVCADQSLNFPDFRAGERTFQLLTQVAGRAGRGEVPGTVIVQTYNPDHYSIVCACRHDYAAFYSREMAVRRQLRYPPFMKLVNVRFECTDRDCLMAEMQRLAALAAERQRGCADAITVLGPAPAPIEKRKGRFRYHMLVKAPATGLLHRFVATLCGPEASRLRKRGISTAIDIDPVSIM